MDFQLIEEGKFKYLDEGKGDVIVLLHGLFGALSNFSDLINHFTKTHRVLIPMLPIYSMPKDQTSVAALKDFLKEFVAHKSLDKITFVGNSLGGHVGLLYCLEDLKTVRSLILTGSSGLFENAMGDSFPRRGDYEYIKNKTAETFYDPAVATKELVDEVFDIITDREKAIRVILTAKSAIRQNVGDRLHEITVPTLLIWGKEDGVTPAFVGEKFNELLPNSELHFVDKCGHAPMMEHPMLFNDIMSAFLAKLA